MRLARNLRAFTFMPVRFEGFMSCGLTADAIALLDILPEPIVLVAGCRLVYANPKAVVVLETDASASRDTTRAAGTDADSKPVTVVCGAPSDDLERHGSPTLKLLLAGGTRTLAVKARPVPVLLKREPALLLVLGEYASESPQLDRVSDLGQLAAGLTHEVANLSSSLLCNLELVVRNSEAALLVVGDTSDPLSSGRNDQIRSLLNAIGNSAGDALAAAKMLGNLVGDVRSLLRGRCLPAREQVASLRTCIERAATMIRFELWNRDCVTIDVDPSLRVCANEDALTRVFLNLLLNAAQAPRAADRKAHTIRVDASAENGTAVVRVQDTGSGIPEAVLPRIFDPFFTTKPVGVGTGLGLYVCQVIVTYYGGVLAASSSDGGGTLFRVTLPMSVRTTSREHD